MSNYELWKGELSDLQDKNREDLISNGGGSIRQVIGLFFLKDEYEVWRNKEANKKLP